MAKFIMIILAILVVIGSIMIYDARRIARKKFSFNEINKKTRVIKLLGYLLFSVGISLFLLV